jgi:hypothetical protein
MKTGDQISPPDGYIQAFFRGIVSRQFGGAFHLANDWIKCAVGVLWGAEIAQASVLFGSEALKQCGSEPRLANTRLARQKHYFAFATLRV